MVVSCSGGIGVWEKKNLRSFMFYRLRKNEGVKRERKKKNEGGEKIGENCREGKKKKKHRVGKIAKRCGKWERTKILAIATETFDVI
jgi:hypothetical protein